MASQSYINRSLFDTRHHKYRITDEIDSSGNYSCLRSEDGHMLKIFKGPEYTCNLAEKIEWLCDLGNTSDISRYIALPISALAGLKRDEVGYVYRLASEYTLTLFTALPKGEKLFGWYFEKTGGIECRLKVLYRLADLLIHMHKIGFCLVDVSPQNFVLKDFNLSKNTPPELQYTNPDAISSYSYRAAGDGQQGYVDPIVSQGQGSPSSISDTFSFAVIAFEVLSTCHPFGGDIKNELSQEEFESAVSHGKLPYIGDPDSVDNKSDLFEDTEVFIPDELLFLFRRMFVSGLHDASVRPRLGDFKNAILQSLRRIVQCDHAGCGRLYPYNQQHVCPFCGNSTAQVIKARVYKSVSATEKLLLPHDNFAGFSALPTEKKLMNWGVLHPGLQKITNSFFEVDAESEDDKICILINYAPDKKRIAVRNRFSCISISANEKTLKPYTKEDKGVHSDATFSSEVELEISLPENIMPSIECATENASNTYGTIHQNWTLMISQGEAYEE